MILLYIVFNVSFAVWVLKGFIDQIPMEYEEAAMVDGYTRFQAFRKIVLPQAVTGIAATAVFCFIFAASVLAISNSARAQDSVADLGQGLFLGSAVLAENLTVWPVYSNKPMAKISGEFITLEDAQKQGKAVIREVGANSASPAGNRTQRHNRRTQSMQNLEPGGVVGELVIENSGEKPILVLAGTLLKGGKQDRQVGQDFVVPPKKKVAVSAFCVEQGRWTASRDGKHTRGLFKAQKALATKSVRKSAQYEKDQGKVWANVAKENKKAGKAPSSGTLMAAVEKNDEKSKKRRTRFLKTVLTEFKKLENQKKRPVGLAYAVDGKVKEVRSFTHPRIFERFKETLFNTVAMEADLAQAQAKAEKRPVYTKKAKAKKVVDLVKSAKKIEAKKHKNKAGNINQMRKRGKVMASDCFEDEAAAQPVTSSYMYAE